MRVDGHRGRPGDEAEIGKQQAAIDEVIPGFATPPGVAAGEAGAACVTRTRDPIITNDVLYQLS